MLAGSRKHKDKEHYESDSERRCKILHDDLPPFLQRSIKYSATNSASAGKAIPVSTSMISSPGVRMHTMAKVPHEMASKVVIPKVSSTLAFQKKIRSRINLCKLNAVGNGSEGDERCG